MVLVDGNSASAAEIVAAALQDNRRAVVVGSNTYGKGTVQTVLPLPNQGEITLTWARFHAPSGYTLHHLGVLPSICTSTYRNADEVMQDLSAGHLPMVPTDRRNVVKPDDTKGLDALRKTCPAREQENPIDLEVALRLVSTPDMFASAVHLAEPPQLGQNEQQRRRGRAAPHPMTAGGVVRPVDAAGLILLRGTARRARRSCWGGGIPRPPSCPTSMSCPAAASIPAITCRRAFASGFIPRSLRHLRRRPAAAARLPAGGPARDCTRKPACVAGRRRQPAEPGQAAVWQAYRGRPAPRRISARSTSCCGRSRRSDRTGATTRASSWATAATAVGDLRGDGELLDLRWWTVAELDRLNIVDVTWALIRLALARWQARVPVGVEPPKLLVYRKNSLVLRVRRTARRARGGARA